MPIEKTLDIVTGKINQYKSLSQVIGEVDTISFYNPDMFSQIFNRTGNSLEEATQKELKGFRNNLLFNKQLYYKFRINPDNLSVSNKKIDSMLLTKRGYERQYHNEDLITYAYSGSTGYMQSFLAKQGINDIRFSEAWVKFEGFKKFYADSQDDLYMYYDGMVHKGFLGKFDFKKDANDPFQMKYNFIFMVYPNESFGISTAFSIPAIQTHLDLNNVSSRIVTII